MSDKSVAKPTPNSLEVANAKMAELIADVEANYLHHDAVEAIAQMAVPILNADNFEDMFYGTGDEPDKELFDIGLEITEISFNKSTYQDGLPFYATFKGKRLDTGKEFVTNCGGWQPTLVAYQMIKNGWLPKTVHFHRAERPTAAGYYPINILPWDAF